MKKSKKTPKETYRIVCERSGGTWTSGYCFGGHCEDCNDKNRDWRGLSFSHTKHRKMGGTTNPEIHSPDNVVRRCYICHDLLDRRTYERSRP